MSEVLEIQARVRDEFSAPLARLKAGLAGVRAPTDMRRVSESLSGVGRAAASAGAALRDGVLGVLPGIATGAGLVTSALLGAAAAVRNFSTGTVEVSRLSREVGIAADQLRVLQALGERVGLTTDQMAQGMRRFASNMYDLSRNTGEMREALLQAGAGGAQLAQQLREAKTPAEALERALRFLSNVTDPQQQRRLAETLFGDGSFMRLMEGGADKFRERWADIEKNIARIGPASTEAAKQFEENLSRLREQLHGVRDEIGMSLVGPMNEFVTTLRGVDWRPFGDAAKSVLGEVTRFIHELSEAIKDVQAFVNDPVGALKNEFRRGAAAKAAGEIGPLEERRAELTKRLGEARGKGDQASVIALQSKIAQLTEAIDALRRKTEELTDQNKAQIEKQSFFDENGGGFGSLIQRASLGPSSGPGMAGAGSGQASGPGMAGAPGQSGGSRSWRNNNPGNLEYGPFARKHGAIGSDGRFAVFPDYATGRAAMQALLFGEGSSYRDKSIAGALNKYAPGSENNTGGYIDAITRGLGVSPGTRLSELTPEQQNRMLDLMQKHERWRPGNAAGLNVKPGAGVMSQAVEGLARFMQGTGLVDRFTSFQDEFHKSRPGSLHNKGLAGDFTLKDPRDSGAVREAMERMMGAAGLSRRDFQIIDEYRNPSPGSTGGHMHYGFRSPEAAAQFNAWLAERMKNRAEAGRMGDDLMRRNMGPQKVEGDARLRIDVNGLPSDSKVGAEGSGMFKKIELNRGTQMAL